MPFGVNVCSPVPVKINVPVVCVQVPLSVTFPFAVISFSKVMAALFVKSFSACTAISTLIVSPEEPITRFLFAVRISVPLVP